MPQPSNTIAIGNYLKYAASLRIPEESQLPHLGRSVISQVTDRAKREHFSQILILPDDDKSVLVLYGSAGEVCDAELHLAPEEGSYSSAKPYFADVDFDWFFAHGSGMQKPGSGELKLNEFQQPDKTIIRSGRLNKGGEICAENVAAIYAEFTFREGHNQQVVRILGHAAQGDFIDLEGPKPHT